METFGNDFMLELNEESEKFEFSLHSNNKCGFLMGESTAKGVIKLDCGLVRV